MTIHLSISYTFIHSSNHPSIDSSSIYHTFVAYLFIAEEASERLKNEVSLRNSCYINTFSYLPPTFIKRKTQRIPLIKRRHPPLIYANGQHRGIICQYSCYSDDMFIIIYSLYFTSTFECSCCCCTVKWTVCVEKKWTKCALKKSNEEDGKG